MTTLPSFSCEPCPDRLSETQVAQFREDGYLAFSNVLKPDEVAAARQAMTNLCGKLTDPNGTAADYNPPRAPKGGVNGAGAFYQSRTSRCFVQLETGFDPKADPATDIETQVRKFMWFCGEDPVFQNFVSPTHRISGVVQSILGSNPMLFQEMALVKPPFIGSEKPWHQDTAYFSIAPLDSVMGVWIALDDARVENGCMHVIPGGQKIGPLRHFHGSDCEIAEGRLDTSKAKAVPVPAGGALFFHGLLPHETPPNRSSSRRRALQFHFRSATSTIVDQETYNSIFVEADGSPHPVKLRRIRFLPKECYALL